MFSLEICHLLNYSFCFYFAIGPTFVLEVRASYTVFVLFTPGSPGAPGVRFYTPENPGGERCERGWLPYYCVTDELKCGLVLKMCLSV